jgi:dTDP-4-dehydrorhamnose reductase
MSIRVLLIGKNGQVGRELAEMLPRLGDVTALGRNELHLENPDHIRDSIKSAHPDLIVNAAAYNAVDRAESEEEFAHAVNAEAPGVIAEEGKKIGAGLVHFSTDYVFDGAKDTPYTEEDIPNPQNTYGRTKLAGEKAIQQSGARHIIFRTSWVYSHSGGNFLLSILRLAGERQELRVVSDQSGAPTWSREIAAAATTVLAQITKNGIDGDRLANVSGIYHMTASGSASRVQFSEAILEEARKYSGGANWYRTATADRPLIATRITPVRSDEYPAPAKRATYSVLSNERLTRTFGVRLPHWREQLNSFFSLE